MYKVLASAVANAENNDNQKLSTLYISTLSVNKGIVYKR
jgi:ribosomal protein L22